MEGFLDNSKEKHLSRINGIPVYYPDDLKHLEKENDFNIIISMKDTEEAKKQLCNIGLEKQIVALQ